MHCQVLYKKPASISFFHEDTCARCPTCTLCHLVSRSKPCPLPGILYGIKNLYTSICYPCGGTNYLNHTQNMVCRLHIKHLAFRATHLQVYIPIGYDVCYTDTRTTNNSSMLMYTRGLGKEFSLERYWLSLAMGLVISQFQMSCWVEGRPRAHFEDVTKLMIFLTIQTTTQTTAQLLASTKQHNQV